MTDRWKAYLVISAIVGGGFTGGVGYASIGSRIAAEHERITAEQQQRVATDDEVRLLRAELRERTDRIIEILGQIQKQTR